MKRFLSLLLIVLALVCTISLVSCNEEQDPFIATDIVDGSQGLEYISVRYGTAYAVYGIGECTDTNIVIPEKVNGKPVIAIAEGAFKNNENIVSVVVPDSVEEIEKKAFSGCSNPNFQSITVGTNDSNLKAMGVHVFFSTFVSTINYKGTMAEWKSIKFDVAEGQSWNYNRGIEITVICNDGKLVYHSSDPNAEPEEIPMKKTEGLEFTLNDDGKSYSLTGVGTCTDTDVVIPSTYNGKPVTNIAEDAFVWNDTIISIVIPDSVTSIERHAFFSCSALVTINIPDSVTSIGEFIFMDCVSLENIDVDENNQHYKSIDGNLYTKNGDTLIQYAIGRSEESFIVPDSVNYIGDYALALSKSLKSITIPESVTDIGFMVFTSCRELANIEVDENNPHFESIDGNLYSEDRQTLIQYAIGKQDTTFTIPYGVRFIGYEAFYRARYLTSVVIPDSVWLVGASAFSECESLVSITIPDSVTEVGEGAFTYCSSLESVTLSNSMVSILPTTFQSCTSLKNIVIPDSITWVGDAFKHCTSLESIVIPDSVEIIDSGAFENCTSLTDVTIGTSVRWMGNQLFKGCSSLANVTFKNPTGWICTEPIVTTMTGTSLSADDLADPEIAATYLTTTYIDYFWRCGE